MISLKRAFGAFVAASIAASIFMSAPALARDGYVVDNAGLFSASAVASLNREIGDFNRQTGKEVVIVTAPSLDGQTLQSAVEKTFAQEQVNGVLMFFAKAEKQDMVVGDRASEAFFPSGSFQTIHDAMRGYLRSGDYDTAVTTGVNLVLDQYRSHERAAGSGVQVRRAAPAATSSFGGAMGLFFLILILLAGFLIIRAVFRAFARPRMMPPGYGPGPGYGGPGYGGPGYGPGYGGGGYGGGNNFFSGLLGGLGGAFLGNELFGGGRNQTIIEQPAQSAGFADTGSGTDGGGWQSDPGQVDMGNAGGGGWGDTGGGFDSGGGGGGFDSGGGGDSGGGW